MNTSPSANCFAEIEKHYLAFVNQPDSVGSEVHVVLGETDPNILLQNKIFLDFLCVPSKTAPALILQPRRFGAIRMADCYADRAGGKIGQEIGLSGVRGTASGPLYGNHKHNVVVTTYGQALSYRNMMQASNVIVMCNTQDRTLHATLAKAAVKRRLSFGEHLFVIILTNDEDQFVADRTYYDGFGTAYHHVVEASAEPAHIHTFVHDPEALIPDKVLSLLREEVVGGKGLVVCVADQNSAARVDNILKRRVAESGWSHVEVTTLYDRMSVEQQSSALREPDEGKLRVLINIGVLETSGLHLPWVTTIVSDGLYQSYEKVSLSGGVAECSTLAPSTVLDQQTRIFGWVGTESTYYLCSSKEYVDRPKRPVPELLLFPKTDVILQTLNVGLDPALLTFDTDTDLSTDLLVAEQHLAQLGLIDRICDNRGHPDEYRLTLTDSGRQTRDLNIGALSKALLAAATRLDVVASVLPLIAVMVVGGVRKRSISSHRLDTESDLLDTTAAFARVLNSFSKTTKSERTDLFESLNISFHRVQSAQKMMAYLAQQCGVAADLSAYLDMSTTSPDLRRKLKACIFAAGVQSLFIARNSDNPKHKRSWVSDTGSAYRLGNSTVISELNSDNDDYVALAGQLRTLIGKANNLPFIIVENVTAFTNEDLLYIHQKFPHLLESTKPDRNGCVTLHRDRFMLAYTRVAKPVFEVPTSVTHATPVSIESSTIELSIVDDTPSVPKKTVQQTKSKPVAETVGLTDVLLSGMIGGLASAWGANVKPRASKSA